MALFIALYTFHAGFHPEMIGWWMIWDLRISLPGLPLLCLAMHIHERRATRRITKG